jgi:predicted CXXCH cytochrome family protein
MRKTKIHPTLLAIFAGFLVWAVCMGLAVQVSQAAGQPPTAQQAATPPAGTPAAAEAAPAQECGECHPDVQNSWMHSSHANATSDPLFVERWKSLGEPGECLLCHTTGYNASEASYTDPGVTCEACHGPAVEGHPPAVMPVRADTEYCGTCHTTTLGEWRLTGHAAANVGCTDCHNPHSQVALFENPDEMCINCHKDDVTEHQENIHITKDIGCIACHALVLPPETPPVDGLVATGHTFTTTPRTCVACHSDALKIGQPLPGYEAGAKAVVASQTMTSTLPTVVAEYTSGLPGEENLSEAQTIQALEAALASARLSTLLQGGIIGLVLGGSTAYFLARNQSMRSKGKEPGPEKVDDSANPEEADEDA